MNTGCETAESECDPLCQGFKVHCLSRNAEVAASVADRQEIISFREIGTIENYHYFGFFAVGRDPLKCKVLSRFSM